MQGVITMSPRISRVLRATYGIRKPMSALPHLNGAVPESEGLLPRPSLLPDGTVRIAFFGRLSALKRPDLLLRLWRSLDVGKARLDIYGDGDLLDEMTRFVAESGLGEQVTVHGRYPQRDALSLMRQAHLIVLPSIGLEGLPQVLVEALACGVPFVATDIGGMPDLGDDNPDVSICGTGDDDVRLAIEGMVKRLRAGDISADRLRAYYRSRYAYEVVAERWKHALFGSDAFFFEGAGAPLQRASTISE